MKNKIQYNEISNEVYGNKNIPYIKIVFISITLLIIGFVLNFPVNDIMTKQITKGLQTNSACPIIFDDLKITFFLPKVVLKKPIISGRCFKQPGQSLKLNDVKLSFAGPSFSPIGIKFKTQIKSGRTNINLFPTISLGGHLLRIDKTVIDSDLVNKLSGMSNLLRGTFNLTALINSSNESLQSGKLVLKSKNIIVPGQNIKGFDVPELNIGNFLLKANMKNSKTTEIIDFIIGNETSPIIATFKGTIKMNKYNFSFSEIDLIGEVKFSDKFMSDFSILNILLPSKKPIDGFYKMQLKGPLNRMIKPKFLN
jgi:type II secretion system protein N